MAKLWGGRFEAATDKDAFEYNASIGSDSSLIEEDIEGSLAHAKMLVRTGIISAEDGDLIINGLNDIFKDIKEGKVAIGDEYEDVHSFVESVLTERIGDAGKRLHTGRSRNDQVALDMKLYTRKAVSKLDQSLRVLQEALFNLMKENLDTFMPGFTHLQKAQSVTVAHHLGAYFEMFIRDRERLNGVEERISYCPLGAGALAGTTYPLDREWVAEELGFKCGPTRNSMDSVSDRDYLIELLGALSITMMHLSRFSEEIILWNSNDYGFVELDDRYSTGSSIMPQKKNPDIAELVRGKTGRVYGALMGLLTVFKGIPLAYDKDMQEDKEGVFDAVDTCLSSIKLFAGMLSTMRFNKEVMDKSARAGFTNATDAADYLVKKGVPFRDAHGIIGRLVLYCISEGKALDDLSLDEWHRESPVFEDDIYEAISLKTCVEKRVTMGAPGRASMEKSLDYYAEYLKRG